MTVPQASTIPGVIAAIISGLSAQAAAGVFVLDGPLPEWPKFDAIVIGYGARGSINHRLDIAGNLGKAYNESYDLVFVVYSQNTTDSAMATRRQKCVDLLHAIRTVLDADRRLGGACEEAILGPSLTWSQQNVGQGAAVYAEGFITVKATI